MADNQHSALNDDSFNQFQLEEYKNISNAHFETNKQISAFYRYYLLIASAPAIIFVWFKGGGNIINSLLNCPAENINVNLFVGFFMFILSIIGMFACFYMISFRLDSILYARTVNGIRNYFFSKRARNDSHFRVLPLLTNQPDYRQKHTFGIIVYSFGLINSIYFAIGARIIASVGEEFFTNYFLIKIPIILTNYGVSHSILAAISFFLLHIGYYRFIANYRKYSYMKTNIIGVDIDGVLNKHRDTFCTMLWEKKGITLWADDIDKIPVHQMTNSIITRNDEFDIFNDPEYWKRQDEFQTDVGKIIQELRNSFGYKIHIHTYRPWPQFSFGTISRVILETKWSDNSIKKITKEWLNRYNIEYDKLYIERTSIDKGRMKFIFLGSLFNLIRKDFKNRFFYTNNKPYRYFVEDDINNAKKLSRYCEYVFLIEQTYNCNTEIDMPINIIRVKDWKEIKEYIKELG
ncbi:hypothetical protein KEM09_02560 [Carboxylicivirga mesophila]|uniref:Uncharacterized protein n=1 Tax=Carboxylicivirga mesophila TaxID=1166478 RepID=A0ABS5K5J8_9BACT|nr:hypothetical protein [Carboxylicivirga mesophila]MBS2210261.1 hypothetical protein [Carboxylicivirga mesophila]